MTRSLAFCLLAVILLAQTGQPKLPTDEPTGHLESVATFSGPMPTGVTVSHKGRIFVNFSRWGDEVEFTVAELKDGKPTALPSTPFNCLDRSRPADCLVLLRRK